MHSMSFFTAILNPGDDVLIPVPYWVSYPTQVALAGGNPIYIPTSNTTSFKVNVALLEQYCTPKTKALILNTPSNPTGSIYTHQEIEAILHFAEEKDILIASDEIYESLIYNNKKHVSLCPRGKQAWSCLYRS